MSFNQQLREPRVLAFLTPRLFALMALVAATLVVAGCKSPPPVVESRPPQPIAAADVGQHAPTT